MSSNNKETNSMHSMPDDEAHRVAEYLKKGTMFTQCTIDNLVKIAKNMSRNLFKHEETIVEEGQWAEKLHILTDGQSVRLRHFNGVEHQIDTQLCGTTINALHLLSADQVYATAKCVTDHCETYSLTKDQLIQIIEQNPTLATQMIVGLTKEIRSKSKVMRTPLFEQHPKPLKLLPIVSVAAGVESYYRSALNALINARLTGKKAALFPNMSVQVPARVLYINGLKGIRQYMDVHVDPQKYSNPALAGACASTIPGLIMTPISSILEASTAGHLNPEPLKVRWIRGITPRAVREVIFGIGINQLSDFFEERALSFIAFQNGYTPSNLTTATANAMGSIAAGICAGYLSHVPHNLSTYKLLHPHKSYGDLFREFVGRSAPTYLIPKNINPSFVPFYTTFIACLFPCGCLLRTTQIVGSFIILNGTINILQRTQ